jgi:MFS transporter, SP family, xylose:H+ symportor
LTNIPEAVATGREHGSLTYVYLLTSVAALGGLLFGYDTAVISGAIGFLQTYFDLDPQLWKGWAAACALIGCAAGAAAAGLLSDRLGRRLVLMISAVLFFVSALGTAWPANFTQFILFRVIGGLGIGAASISSPMYIAEVAPARLRGRLVSLNQFAIVSGILLVYFVNYFIAGYGASVDPAWNVQYGWRWMFGSGAVPSILLFALLLLVPESPRWLVQRNRREEALRVLSRVGGAVQARQELADIEATIARETGSLRQLLEPGLRVVLVIGVVLAVLQQVTGINVFLYYAPEIFKKMGSGVDAALLETVLVGGVNLVFTIVAIYTVDRLGRVPLMLIGAAGMGLCLTAMGLASYWQQTDVWVLLFIVGYIGCFALSVGPVTWVILSEIFPTRIRGRAMALATVCLWLANYVVTQTFTVMDEDQWLVDHFHHAFPFWVYALLCGVMVLFVWLLVPETKGKTLEEIERGWMKARTRG